MKVFLSFNPSVAEAEMLAALQSNVRHAMEAQLPLLAAAVRWTRISQFHVTVEFLGDLSAARLGELEPAIAAAAAASPPDAVTVDGLGAFPVYRAPQVIWLRVRQSPGVMELQRLLRLHLMERGFRFDNAYFPHITIGRLKKTALAGPDIEAFCGLVDRFRDSFQKEPLTWPTRQLALMRSRHASGGAEYACIQTYRVGPKVAPLDIG